MAVRKRKRKASRAKKVVYVKTYHTRKKRAHRAKKSLLDKILDF